LPRVKASGDMRINGARPPHSGQMTGAARESCAGARNVGIASPRGTPQVSKVCKETTRLSIVFGNFLTAEMRNTVAAGAFTKIHGNEVGNPPLVRLSSTEHTWNFREA
jgi:hypothetical protein